MAPVDSAPWLPIALAWTLLTTGCAGKPSQPAYLGAGGSSTTTKLWPPQCIPEQCVCTDGFVTHPSSYSNTGTVCPTASCLTACAAHGGLRTLEPIANVYDSAQCSAWVQKLDKLPCATTKLVQINAMSDCSIRTGSCELATENYLACLTERVDLVCDSSGVGWNYQTDCRRDVSVCADGGVDAGAGGVGAGGAGANTGGGGQGGSGGAAPDGG